jgi:IS30 family transposase
MKYRQITSEQRYTLAVLRRQEPKLSIGAIAELLGFHRSTIYREFQRNSCADGGYRPSKASRRTRGRRSRSRRNSQFTPADMALVNGLLQERWSPEQIAGSLRRHHLLRISHETIYNHVWRDKERGGSLFRCLRQAPKRFRKRYGRHDSRGRLAGKKHLSERPAAIMARSELGHWEMDTVMGKGSKHCILSLVERATGYTLIGKLPDRTAQATTIKAIELIKKHHPLFTSITVDNGTEFHDYKTIEYETGVDFYFATPYHSWERGTNENTNGLIRQYLPKRTSMAHITQHHCDNIARALNTRPRKRYAFRSPTEVLRDF